MNIYWIDSYGEYDPELVNSVMELFEKSYRPLLKTYDLDFQVVDIKTIDFNKSKIICNGKDILNEKAIAYINCTNPVLETEKLQSSLYKVAIKSKWLSVLNYVSGHPLVDKNKLDAINLAMRLGIKTIPTISLEKPRSVSKLVAQIQSELDLPTVIKPVDMFGGIAVHIVNSTEELTSMIEILGFASRSFVAQKKFDIVSDCRLYISNSKFLACLKRIPKSKSGLGNIAKGAIPTAFLPPLSVIENSIMLANSVGASFLCVDWFELANGEFIFSEIETAGGFVQLPETERKLVAEKMFRWKPNEK